MNKYQLEVEAEEDENYKQEFGLRKMLYKYENENEQLRNQIRALTERLTSILEKSPREEGKKEKELQTIQDVNEKYWKEQMNILFKQIEQTNEEIKKNKEIINEGKEGEYVILMNKIKSKDEQLLKLRNKVKQFENEEESYKASKENKLKVTREE